eukprot:6353385-Prymnesium_polylepis.1
MDHPCPVSVSWGHNGSLVISATSKDPILRSRMCAMQPTDGKARGRRCDAGGVSASRRSEGLRSLCMSVSGTGGQRHMQRGLAR